jgi:hypothetical protein
MADFIVDMLGVARRVLQLMKGSRSRTTSDSKKRFWDRETYLDCNFPKVHGAHFDKEKASFDRKYRLALVNELMEKNPCDELSVGSVVPFNDSKIDENRRIKINSDEMKSMASQLFQNAVQAGLIYNTFSGVLRCNVDVSKLAQAKSGFLRGFVIEDGQIAEHAEFCELSAAEVAPLAVFVIASFVTGQYYQHIITGQLNSINQKIDQVLNLLEANDRATLFNDFRELKNLNDAKIRKPEDFLMLRNVRKEIGQLQHKYREIVLNSISFEDVGLSIFDKNEAIDWEDALNKSKFIPYMNVAFLAEYLYYLSTMLLIGWESSKPDPDKGVIESWAKTINSNFMEPYAEKYHKIKCMVCLHLALLEVAADWRKEDVRATRIRIEEMFQSFDSSVRMTVSKLNPDFYIRFENGKPVVD